MNKSMLKMISQGLLFSGLALMWACDPAPRRELNAEEKQADMMWLYSKFGANYAPMKYKEELHGIDFQNLKSSYLDAAAETKDNDEFYALIHQFVAEFKDAHLGASISASGRKGRETVKYLGFNGRRVGDLIEVTAMAPTHLGGDYPISVGSMISKVNGVPVKEYVLNEAIKYEDLGQEESNLTAHMSGRMFAKLSTLGPLPKEKDITLTLKEGDVEVEVTVPWIEKDLYTYRKDMKAASPQAAASTKKTESFLGDDNSDVQIPFALLDFNGVKIDLDIFKNDNKKSSFKDRIDNFMFTKNVASWTASPASANVLGGKKGSLAALAQVRSIPLGAMAIPTSHTYPSYIWPETVMKPDPANPGQMKETKVWMGYILLHSFSVNGDPVPEFKQTLSAFQQAGVEDIVIDTVNNGGGSLFLLMDLAQALSNKKIVQPSIQIGTNEGWIDSLEDWADGAASDAEKELAKRLYNEVLSSDAQGLKITPKATAYNLEVMAPWKMKGNTELTKEFNVVLLVNEMCASSCDIFAGVLQDNKLATLVGQRTMGAGGNVVSYMQAPNSNMDIRQVESLIVRSNGEYIENVGVTPDHKMNVSETAPGLYEGVRAKGVELLRKRHETPAVFNFGAPMKSVFSFGTYKH